MNGNGAALAKRRGLGDRKVRVLGQKYTLSEMGAGYLLLIPSIVFLAFLFVYPVIRVIYLSLTNFNMATGVMDYVGLRNYEYLIGNDRFWKSLLNTCLYAAAKLAIDTSLALLLAVMLDSRIPFRRFLRSSYFAPVVVPVVASSLIWIWFYDPSVGPFNQILSWVGLPQLRWLYNESTSLMSILIFSIWKGLGYNIILFLAGLQSIQDSYLEAARVDGASEWSIFWRVKFPLLRPVTSFILMIGIINSFKVFTEVNVMMPKDLKSMIQLIVNYIYEQAFTNGRMGRASAAALMLFVIIFVLTMVQRMIGARKSLEID